MYSLPSISIVTPSFNQGQFLEKCINSILSQNYPRLEYIIMDGGSTDGSVDIIRKYEQHLAYWQSQPDGGHYNAVQYGLKRATGDILCWLNSDDMFHPGGLFQVSSVFLNNVEVEWITGKRVGFDSLGNLLSYGYEKQTWSRENLLNPDFINGHIFVMQEATFWKRSLWERAGGELDLSFDLAADFELWCRFSRYARLHTVDALLAGYRYHGLAQRSQQFRPEYVAQCQRIILRESEIVTNITQYDAIPPPTLSVKAHADLLQVMVKNSLPVISIVTPSYNQEEYLEECIDSILSQNYPNLEYVIMDGGSTDSSVEIIKRHEKYLKYWQSCPDGGQYRAIDEGFKKTSGEIMAWLNSDDKYHRDAFYKVAAVFAQVIGAEWISGYPTFWGKHGEFTHIESLLPTYCRKDFLDGRYNQPFIQQESTFWKRSLWNRAGGYVRTDLNYAGDLELWIRFFRHSVLYSANTFLGGYRSHGNQKASLYMDRYVAEAETILTEERNLLGNDYVLMSPQPPTPVNIDRQEFLAYLNEFERDKLHASPYLIAAGEEAVQLLLCLVDALQTDLSAQRTHLAGLVSCDEEIGQLRSSLSWRLTKPLRWLGDMVRLKT